MQFTTHILLSNKQVVGSWTLPSDVAVASEPTHCTWVEADQLYVNIHRSENLVNGLYQFEQRIGAAILEWLKSQMPGFDHKRIGEVEFHGGELLVAGLRYVELTPESWASMPAYVEDSLLERLTPLWLSQFGKVVTREQLTRGNAIECVCDDRVVEVHSRYGAVSQHHDSINLPREHFGELIRMVLGKGHIFAPQPGTPIYTGYATPLQYMMHVSREEMRKRVSA